MQARNPSGQLLLESGVQAPPHILRRKDSGSNIKYAIGCHQRARTSMCFGHSLAALVEISCLKRITSFSPSRSHVAMTRPSHNSFIFLQTSKSFVAKNLCQRSEVSACVAISKEASRSENSISAPKTHQQPSQLHSVLYDSMISSAVGQ